MARGSPSQSLIPRKCSVPQSLMLKYPINCKSSHNHILDLNNSLKMHGLVCILEMAKGVHNVPKRYAGDICGTVAFFLLFILLHIAKGTTAYHRTRWGWGGVELHLLYTELPLIQPWTCLCQKYTCWVTAFLRKNGKERKKERKNSPSFQITAFNY